MPSQFEVFTKCPKTGEFVSTGATVTKPVFDDDVHAGGAFNCTSCNEAILGAAMTRMWRYMEFIVRTEHPCRL